MADFNQAYKLVSDFEGSYSNVKSDRGGETYCGIARNFFPKWPGWAILDREKSIAMGNIAKMKKALSQNTEISSLVKRWYKTEWWDFLGLGNLDQNLANEIFEQAINLGKAGCGKKVQQVCNAYNAVSGTPLFTDLVVDGAIGPKTLSALSKIINRGKASVEQLVHALNCMQGAHYIELAAKKPDQRIFTVGWMKRTYCEVHK